MSVEAAGEQDWKVACCWVEGVVQGSHLQTDMKLHPQSMGRVVAYELVWQALVQV